MDMEKLIKENEELKKLVLKAQELLNSNVEVMKELKLENINKDKEIVKLKTKVEIYEKFIKSEKKLFNKVKDIVIDKEKEKEEDKRINEMLDRSKFFRRLKFMNNFKEKVNEMLETEIFNLEGIGYEKKRK